MDPTTKLRIDRPTDRVNLLIADLDTKNEQILIPMPALAEFLVMVGSSGASYLNQIHKLPRFVIGDFTEKAAIEVSQVIRKALDSLGKQKRDEVEATWAKVNFDRQIAAIAKAAGCTAIYSTDGDVKKHAAKMKLDCVHLADLPLPPAPRVDPQLTLLLGAADNEPERMADAAVSGAPLPGNPPSNIQEKTLIPVAAPAAMPASTAQNVSAKDQTSASDLPSIGASSVETVPNLKKPSTTTITNQRQPDQTSEESNPSNPETDLTKVEGA